MGHDAPMKAIPLRAQLSIYRTSCKASTLVNTGEMKMGQFVSLPPGVEGTSCGWVTKDNIDQISEDEGELLIGLEPAKGQKRAPTAYWWRLRVDQRKVPTHLVEVALERAAQARGKKLSKKEKREVRDSVAESVLPTLAAKTTLFNVLMFEGYAVLLNCSAAARESFVEAFGKSFPDRKIDRLLWEKEGGAPHPILQWLYTREQGGMGDGLQVVFDGAISVQHGEDHVTIDTDEPAIRSDTFESFKGTGARLRSAVLTACVDGPVWRVRANAWSGAISVALTDAAEGESDPLELSGHRLSMVAQFVDAWVPMVVEAESMNELAKNATIKRS